MHTDARELTEEEIYARQQLGGDFDEANHKKRAADAWRHAMTGSKEGEIELKLKLQKDLVKEALKEALKEWLDDKFLTFGKWSLGAISAAALALLAWGLLVSNGWQMKFK